MSITGLIRTVTGNKEFIREVIRRMEEDELIILEKKKIGGGRSPKMVRLS